MNIFFKHLKYRNPIVNIILIATFISFTFLMFSFIVLAENDNNPVTIDSLLNDSMLEVSNFNWNYGNVNRTLGNSEWEQIQKSNMPLSVGESYTEDFSKNYFSTRLRPYTATYFTPDVPRDATFSFKENNGKRAVVVQTNGEAGGVYDYIEFYGMRFLEGAFYTVTVDYTVITPNRLFKLGFGATAACEYFADLSGDTAGMNLSCSGSFTASEVNNNAHSALILMVAGGKDPASIQIDKITIQRLPSKPRALNTVINGNLKIGQTLSLSYEYYQDSGVKEGSSDIIWFTATDNNGKDMSVISSTKGKKSIVVTQDMQGFYIGAYMILKTEKPTENGIGDGQIAVTRNAVGSPLSYGVYDLDEDGKYLFEDFEKIESSGNFSFKPDKGAFAYISDDANVTLGSGKALYIKSQGGMKGGIFSGASLNGGKQYVVSFKYKFISTPPANLQIQMRSPSLGTIGDIYQRISAPISGEIKTYTSKPFILSNENDFYLQIFDVTGPYELVIDDIKIECVKPPVIIPGPPETPSDSSTLADLATIGKPFTENFTKNALGSLWSYDLSHFSILSDVNAIAGNSVMQDFTNASNGGIYAFDTKDKLSAGAKYKVALDYKVLTDKMPSGMYFGFTRDGGANQKNIKVDFSGNEKNKKYTFSAEYTLDNFNDYYVQWFNLNAKDGSIIVIDTLIIEKVADKQPDPPTLADLAIIGKPFVENFTDNALGSLWSYDLNHFSIISDVNAIAGNSLKQVFTNASFGGIYAFATKGKLSAAGKYKVTLDYKVLTDKMPTGMYFGFTRDGGANQKNIQFDFLGKAKNTVYQFSAEYTLDNFGDYYVQWFNLSANDGSIIVIDNLKIERIA